MRLGLTPTSKALWIAILLSLAFAATRSHAEQPVSKSPIGWSKARVAGSPIVPIYASEDSSNAAPATVPRTEHADAAKPATEIKSIGWLKVQAVSNTAKPANAARVQASTVAVGNHPDQPVAVKTPSIRETPIGWARKRVADSPMVPIYASDLSK